MGHGYALKMLVLYKFKWKLNRAELNLFPEMQYGSSHLKDDYKLEKTEA